MGQAHGLKELSVGDIRMVFSGSAPVRAARQAAAAASDEIEMVRAAQGDDLDIDAIDNDPRFIAYSRHGANPVAG